MLVITGNTTLFKLIAFRDRPAAIPIDIKSIDDTSNFDEFPDVDLKWRKYYSDVITSCIVSLIECVFELRILLLETLRGHQEKGR